MRMTKWKWPEAQNSKRIHIEGKYKFVVEKNPCRMYFSGQMSVYLLMEECEHWRAFDHKIYFAGYDYIGNRKKYYWLCRRASNCPFPNAQGCSSGRKQSVRPLLALSSFILHNAGSASRLLSKSPRFLLESRDYGRITTGESCFKNSGLYTALKSAVINYVSSYRKM